MSISFTTRPQTFWHHWTWMGVLLRKIDHTCNVTFSHLLRVANNLQGFLLVCSDLLNSNRSFSRGWQCSTEHEGKMLMLMLIKRSGGQSPSVWKVIPEQSENSLVGNNVTWERSRQCFMSETCHLPHGVTSCVAPTESRYSWLSRSSVLKRRYY